MRRERERLIQSGKTIRDRMVLPEVYEGWEQAIQLWGETRLLEVLDGELAEFEWYWEDRALEPWLREYVRLFLGSLWPLRPQHELDSFARTLARRLST